MALPPRPKQPTLVRRVLAISALAACAPRPVPPQVVRGPDEMEQAPPPQVNCGGVYAGECRGAITVIVRDEAGAPVPNIPVAVMTNGQTYKKTTDANGQITVGAESWEGLPPGGATITIDAAGFAPVEQTASIDAGPVQIDVVLRRQP